MTKFTDIDETIEVYGFTLTARIAPDNHMGEPWNEHDGHGEVSDWTTRDKRPGELELSRQGCGGASGLSRRFYDFAAACRTARADGWGPPAYRLDIEQGANGLCRASAHWFEGREMRDFRSDWYDEQRDAIADVYRQYRETMTARQWAALAARADFERMRSWCDDGWNWVGVIVTASKDDVELASASLWGIESDAGAYLVETANELSAEAISNAREKLKALTA